MNRKFKKLKAYRQLKGINQSVIAELLGVSLNTYNFKENGKKSFTLEEAKQIADYFETSIDEIFFNNSVPNVGTESSA
ncbi:helix-turn-helix transcriptional regulator [Clostridium oceanicum]|uniref:Helix-turn-helix transcriptional regulator n=1 Tax=Clostridium oceanicum TaxID=1543 RepID=A0ABN1JC11_9CLOT